MANIAVVPTTSMFVFSKTNNRLAYRVVQDDLHVPKPTHHIEGYVRTTGGDPIAGAVILLFRQVDNVFLQATVTNDQGYYRFLRNTGDTTVYYTVGYTAINSTQVHGTSDRGLVPTAIPAQVT